jgi:hypothetical protein
MKGASEKIEVASKGKKGASIWMQVASKGMQGHVKSC